MAVTAIAHKPNLTVEQTKALFEKQFAGKYTIEDWKGPSVGFKRDFMVVKNPFAGVAVKLEQDAMSTKFVYAGLAPRMWARMLFGGLIGILLWNGPTTDVKNFLESAPEFH